MVLVCVEWDSTPLSCINTLYVGFSIVPYYYIATDLGQHGAHQDIGSILVYELKKNSIVSH